MGATIKFNKKYIPSHVCGGLQMQTQNEDLRLFFSLNAVDFHLCVLRPCGDSHSASAFANHVLRFARELCRTLIISRIVAFHVRDRKKA